MRGFFFWVLFYTLIMAVSQILLKHGVNQIGGFKIKAFKDVLLIIFEVLKNPAIMLSIVFMVSSFFLWIFILSWFKLGLIFPLTAMTYVFVAFLSYFFLKETLSLFNYLGVFLIASGVFFLLYK